MKKYLLQLFIALSALALLYLFLASYTKNADIANLPYYTLNTLTRLTIAYFISLAFGLVVGIALGLNKTFSKMFLPVFDVLQSIPILGYFPAAVIILVSLFNGSQFGIELAAQLLLFTSMAWNTLFAVYGAVKTIPSDVMDAAKEFGIKGFDFIRHIVIPYIIPALMSGSSLAWGNGWFFIIASEFITFSGKTYILPGIGSLIAKASFVDGNLFVASVALVFMTAVVLITNQFIWSRLMRKAGDYRPVLGVSLKTPFRLSNRKRTTQQPRHTMINIYQKLGASIPSKLLILVFLLTFFSVFVVMSLPNLISLETFFKMEDVVKIPSYTLFTLIRIFAAYALSLAVGMALGIAAAENDRIYKIVYPIYGIGYSIPTLAIFPIIIVYMFNFFPKSVGLEITSLIVLFLSMVWYIFISVMGAVKNIPKSISELAAIYKIRGLRKLRHITIPAIIPAIVTGSMLAIAGGWNVIIFSEYVVVNNVKYSLPGLGYLIDKAAYQDGNTLFLILLLGIISAAVIIIENAVWKRLLEKTGKYKLEED